MHEKEAGVNLGLILGLGVLGLLALWFLTKKGSSENAETWSVERDPTTGRLTGITVHRQVNPQ